MNHLGFENSGDARAFMFAGNATVTMDGREKRYTFKFTKSEDEKMFFVKLLTGPDNVRDYTYLGFVFNNDRSRIIAGRAGNRNHGAFVALNWVLGKLAEDIDIPDQLTILHAGRCGRCNRVLTVPESIESGFGPECIQYMRA